MKIAPELVVPLKNDIESNLCTPSLYSRCMEFLKGVNENCTRASCSFEKMILNQIYAYHHDTVGLIFCIGVKQQYTLGAYKFSKVLRKIVPELVGPLEK